jgi:hypothetical protein
VRLPVAWDVEEILARRAARLDPPGRRAPEALA